MPSCLPGVSIGGSVNFRHGAGLSCLLLQFPLPLGLPLHTPDIESTGASNFIKKRHAFAQCFGSGTGSRIRGLLDPDPGA